MNRLTIKFTIMKTQIIIIALFFLTILNGCQDESLCLTGSGPVHTYEIQTEPFNAVTILGPVNLRYMQDNTTYVTVETQSEMFRHLSYHVEDNELIIGYKDNVRCFETEYGVWINVHAPVLRKINAEGVNEITTAGPIDQKRIEVVTEGTATVKLSGHVEEQILKGWGVLIVQNFSLQSDKTVIESDGVCNAEVSCSMVMDIDSKGSATIHYKGHPGISNTGKGTLTLHDAN